MSEKPTLKKPRALTRSIIAQMVLGEEMSDADCRGLRVRRTKTACVFFYRYRAADGALRQIKLGEFGVMSIPAARAEVSKRRQQLLQGTDPQLERRNTRATVRQRAATEKQETYTVTQLLNDYIDENLSKQKRGLDGIRLLRKEFESKCGARTASKVTRHELLNDVIRPVMLRAPRMATYLLSRIRCAYVHADEQGRLPENFVSPTVGIKGAAQVRRKRAFTNAELAAFLRWLPHSPYSRDVRDSMLLVLLTGCRSGEVVGGQWAPVDLQRGVWHIIDTKNGLPHDVMLPRQAIELLSYRVGIDPVHVFPSPRNPGRHINQKALGLAHYTARHLPPGDQHKDPIVEPWTVHDLRRTVATGLARLGCSRVVQDRILNHVDGSVSAIYDTHRYDDEAREWLQRWADHLDGLRASAVPLRLAA